MLQNAYVSRAYNPTGNFSQDTIKRIENKELIRAIYTRKNETRLT